MKYIKQFIETTDELAEPLRRGFLETIHKHSVHQTKEQAVFFARKYLEIRKEKVLNTECIQVAENTWNIVVDYILLDIIPHIYGEALD